MLAVSSCSRASFFLQLFLKFVQSRQSTTFIQKFLTKFSCSRTFKDVQLFHQNSIFVAETYVYIKSIDSKPPSSTKQREFGIQVSKYVN